MNHVAAFPAEERNELFALTAERLGMGSTAIVEKDFWVCWTLKRLFEHEALSKQLLFKGGTSLSKVFGLINRFSEDIDLILDWRAVTNDDPMAERSKTKQGHLNEAINEQARVYIAETLVPLFDEALGSHCSVSVLSDEKDLGHIVRVHYEETEKTQSILPYIQLEIGPLASWLPHSHYTIRPYAAESFPDVFRNADCPVVAIEIERTFWEKATILHHEAHRPKTSPMPVRYSRHYYDLFQMASDERVKKCAVDHLGILDSVVAFKKKFYPRAWGNYDQAKPGTLKLIPPAHVLEAMRKDYDAMQDMIFGQRPSFDEIIAGLQRLEEEVNACKPS